MDINSKWKKYLILKNNQEIAKHLPETMMFSLEKELWDFIKKYHKAILKPEVGARGRKIFKVSALKSGKIEIHYLDIMEEFERRDKALAYLNEHMLTEPETESEPYLIQRYIPLANIKGCPFDIRVIVQKERNSNDWFVTGKAAKLAGKGFFVTNNGLSSGVILPVTQAIKTSNIQINHKNIDNLVSEIERITLLATQILKETYKEQTIFGFDMGVDSEGNIWMIEVNLAPALSHFKKLEDKTMFNRIKKLRDN